jgi:quinol monooxygenase YgiN
MHVTLVHIHVRAEHVEPFIAATIHNHDGYVREPGNVRFEVLVRR